MRFKAQGFKSPYVKIPYLKGETVLKRQNRTAIHLNLLHRVNGKEYHEYE